jgi:hypothetical protein
MGSTHNVANRTYCLNIEHSYTSSCCGNSVDAVVCTGLVQVAVDNHCCSAIIGQSVLFTLDAGASSFNGARKNTILAGYAHAIGILQSDNKTYIDGCSLNATATATAVSTRRSGVVKPTFKVFFTWIVPLKRGSSTKENANTGIVDRINAGVNAVTAADSSSFSSSGFAVVDPQEFSAAIDITSDASPTEAPTKAPTEAPTKAPTDFHRCGRS